MKRLIRALVALVALGYLGAVGYLMASETRLLYHPAERAVEPPSAVFALRQLHVEFRAADSTRLTAWIVPAAAADSTDFWLLICHGNYGSIGYGQRPDFYALMRDVGLNLFAFDYRGFGASEGSPREKGVYDDATSAYRFLRDSLRVPADRIVIYGHSLGSGVAIELATRVPAAAVIVEGAYTSVVDRAQELYPWLPIRLVVRNRFASIDKIADVQQPKLFLHSPEDDKIPIAHGRRLFAAAVEPKRFVEVPGGHENAFRTDTVKYFAAIRALLDELRAPPRP